jgi:hypothetical protein
MASVPNIAFHGVTPYAQQRVAQYPGPEFGVTDLIGLCDAISCPVFPMHLAGLNLVLSVYCTQESETHEIVLRSPQGEDVWRVKIVTEIKIGQFDENAPKVILESPGVWNLCIVPMSDPKVSVFYPGAYTLSSESGAQQVPLGKIVFLEMPVQPLTPDVRAAIESNPFASEAVVYFLECDSCAKRLEVYASLDRPKNLESKGMKWYRDLDDEFTCDCAQVRIPLKWIRSNLHYYLGNTSGVGPVSLEPIYTSNVVDDVREEFATVLSSFAQDEKRVQAFIEANPIVLSRFNPLRLFYRPPILTKYRADFVILDPSGELLFIEIERPGLRMSTAKGEPSAEFNHAFNQVSDWLDVIDDHRDAVLQCISPDLSSKSINRFTGVVILGRNSSVSASCLRSLKKQSRSRIDFLTYDDLLGSLGTISSQLSRSSRKPVPREGTTEQPGLIKLRSFSSTRLIP